MSEGKTVEGYIAGLSEWQADVVRSLRTLVHEAAPDAKESIKWAQPVYDVNGPCVYISAFPKSVNLGFWRGAALPDPEKLLQSGGERMAHVKVTGPADLRPDALKALIRAAVQMNRDLGNPTRRARR